ncbi:peptidoglycan DD-metalloendopeptidase family protein [Novosphingobium sp.]|uniref:murein hydrolase activator EnvC family protein n=1 Tax=Novosphingobium sp. TaxID=1874826 RepID=UPI0025FEAE6C|nr:peptidoglycan DD-metalloendopeptidase family protein [Novosphingobium sp.]MCC6927113.1 peptidoglycan DD-metalloendopeptidase family protein [Novosphingobium sp.]
MTLRWPLLLAPLAVLGAVGAGFAQQTPPQVESAEDAQAALDRAKQQGGEARSRAEALEAQAVKATAEADRTAQEAAALAARVQEAEAQIAANEAQIRIIGREQAVLRAELAEKQRPLVELTAALQRLSRRPPLLSLLRPGSLNETVYLRAVLNSLLPEVARRTKGLRDALARSKALADQAGQANQALRANQAELTRRRSELAAIEARQRLASRAASVSADRESERALALAEQARDLSGLVVDLSKAGAVREQLAALPGPVLRPAQPLAAQLPSPEPAMPAAAGPGRFILPAAGRLVAGFGESRPGQPQSRGLSILVAGGAQVVAPAAGRVAFAGPYRGHGLIVIVEHGQGLTSLVTGLAELDCRVGEALVAGGSLGRMGPGRPLLTFELRRQGQPVNPLDFVR